MRELSGIGKNRQRALAALGAETFGHVAGLPSPLLRQKFGIWGQQLWLFANGLWSEPLLLEVKDRTTISSNTTLPYDEPDYEAALTFTLSEATRLIGQLRREQLQARELGLTIRFTDFSEVSGGHRFREPQFQNSVINTVLEGIFRELMGKQFKPVRQIRIAFWNLARLDTQPTLWGRTHAERWGALDDAAHVLNGRFGPTAIMTGAQLALRELEDAFKNPKAKCPFVPQREMVKKLWGTDADPLAHKGEWEKRLAKVSKQLRSGIEAARIPSYWIWYCGSLARAHCLCTSNCWMNFCAHTAEENVRAELPCNQPLWLKFVLPSQQSYWLEPDCCTTKPFQCQIWAGAWLFMPAVVMVTSPCFRFSARFFTWDASARPTSWLWSSRR